MSINQNPLVSIVVPVFNVAEYLPECIDSILSQTYENFELILVNDGSTDSSSKVLQEYAKIDKRVKIVNKENKGVSSARNVGLALSSGELITFIDSDDWVDEAMIRAMVECLQKNDVDVVSCGIRRVAKNGDRRTFDYDFHQFESILKRNQLYLELVNELIYGGGSIYSRLIRKDQIGALRFNESMRISEDQDWMLGLVSKVDSGIYINDVFYNLRMRPESATTKSKASDVRDIERVDSAIMRWAEKYGESGNKIVMNALFVRSRLQYSAAVRSGSEKEMIFDLRTKMKDYYKKSHRLPKKEYFKYLLALMPPALYPRVRTLLKKIRGESV